MKKRFIVLLNPTTDVQNKAFVEWIKSAGLGWWHYLTGAWLLTDASGLWTATEIRDALRSTFPGVHSLVLEFRPDGDTWAGFGPTAPTRNMFQWIKDNW